MKTRLLKLALCAMALLPMGAWADEVSVSTTTTWTFDGLTASTVYNSLTVIDGYYLRTSSSAPNRSFTVTGGDEQTLVFSDNYTVKVTNYIVSNGAMQNYNDTYLLATQTAGNDAMVSSKHVASCSFAFNASVAGTVYVYGTNADDNKKLRIIFTDGENKKTTDKTNSGALALTEVSYTSTKAGSFFIGGPESTFRIYAVRFVPTSEKKSAWVYVGSTGYATFGNTSGGHLILPSGLKAYKAKASDSGHSVTLTEVSGIRSAAGYIVKGTANTNYGFESTDVDPGGNSGTELVRASSDMNPFNPTNGDTGDALRYHYILGNDGGTAKFFVPSGEGTLKKGKAYLATKTELTPETGARGFDIIFDEGETTGISAALMNNERMNNEVYNLSGQRVAQPTKGLYIVNGKKVIIK